MTIEELLAATGLTANDLVPIWDAEAAQSEEPTQKITAAQLAAAVKVLANLQDKLTFDTTPTTGSTNPVTSGGVADAIEQSTATGGARYFKSPDGTLINWGFVSVAVSSWSAWGTAMVTGTATLNASFANAFVGEPCVVFTPNSANWQILIEAHWDTNGITSMTVARPNNNASSQRWSYIAIGRWK